MRCSSQSSRRLNEGTHFTCKDIQSQLPLHTGIIWLLNAFRGSCYGERRVGYCDATGTECLSWKVDVTSPSAWRVSAADRPTVHRQGTIINCLLDSQSWVTSWILLIETWGRQCLGVFKSCFCAKLDFLHKTYSVIVDTVVWTYNKACYFARVLLWTNFQRLGLSVVRNSKCSGLVSWEMWLLAWFESRLENVIFHGHSMRSFKYCYLKIGITDSCLAWPCRNHSSTL